MTITRSTRSTSASPCCERRSLISAASRANRSRAAAEYGCVARVLDARRAARSSSAGSLVGDRGVHRPRERLLAALVVRPVDLHLGQLGRPPPEQAQVARADPPARTGQDPQHRRVRGRVVHDLQRRDHVGDAGQREQAAQPDHLDRHAGGGEPLVERGDHAVLADEDRDLLPRRSGVVPAPAGPARPRSRAPRRRSRSTPQRTSPCSGPCRPGTRNGWTPGCWSRSSVASVFARSSSRPPLR